MELFQALATTLVVIVIVILMFVFTWHYIGLRANAWIKSNREEKIGLSKSKLFNANGYMIHSNSDFLLKSSGSFKRFESIDKDLGQNGQSSLSSPPWNLPITDIPPQPLRPAPIIQASNKIEEYNEKHCEKEWYLNNDQFTVIPRPLVKRQLSSPNCNYVNNEINLSNIVAKIEHKSQTSTNPFLQNKINKLENNDKENLTNNYHNIANKVEPNQMINVSKKKSNNPFTSNSEQILASINEPSDLKTNSEFKKTSTLIDFDVPESFKNTQNINLVYIDPIDNIEQMLRKHFRNRSLSDTEATDTGLSILSKNADYFKKINTNPFIDTNIIMQKTCSENIISRNNNTQNWGFNHSFSRNNSISSLGKFNSSQSSLDSEKGSLETLQRALSCDSVNSESSVMLTDLEQPIPLITGYLCVGLQYDKNSVTDQGVELVVTIMEAKELIGPQNVESFDTFVRVYLAPDKAEALQTKVFKDSTSPSYNETFCFWLRKSRGQHSLWFHLYHSGNAHTLIGEAEMQICDVARPITTWLPLSDSRLNNAQWGELMFSISYLPTAERLTVVVVKARNLKFNEQNQDTKAINNIFVKVYLLKDVKKVSKKKTSLKRADRCPIFNESMIFSIPPYVLHSIQIRLTVMRMSNAKMLPIGHVIIGSNTSGKCQRHWNQMLSSLRKPVAMWHALCRTNTKNESGVT